MAKKEENIEFEVGSKEMVMWQNVIDTANKQLEEYPERIRSLQEALIVSFEVKKMARNKYKEEKEKWEKNTKK